MDKPIELKEVNKLKETNGNKPRASSTSEIETQLSIASTSTPKRPRSKIQFKLSVSPPNFPRKSN